MKLLLETGQIDVNHILKTTDHPDNGHTALTLASMNGHDDVVELLLKNEKIDVNQMDGINGGKKWTALFFASDQANRAIVELILAKDGVDVNALDIHEENALMWAKNTNIAQLILDYEGIERSSIEQGCKRGQETQVKELICQHLSPGKNSDAIICLLFK